MITRKRCPLCMHEDRSQLEADLEAMNYTADALDQQMNWKSGTTAKHQRNHMGEYEKSSNPRCKICTSPMRAEIEKRLHDTAISPIEVAEMVGCTEDQVYRHVTHHLQPLVQKSAANMIAVKEVNEIDTLSNNIARLDGKLDTLFDNEDLSPKAID